MVTFERDGNDLVDGETGSPYRQLHAANSFG